MNNIAQKLINTAQSALEASLALHTGCKIIIDQNLAEDAIQKHEAFEQLAKEVEKEMRTRLTGLNEK